MTKKNVDKIKEQISKLLAKANGTDNKEEASVFMAKVEEMLTKHQLEIGDVIKNDPMERTVVFIAPIAAREWHKNVPDIMCRYYGCEMIMIGQRGATLMTAIGRESTRVTAELMIPFVINQLRDAAKQYRADTGYSMRRSMDDVSAAFWLRVRKLIDARETVEKAHGKDDRALVLINEAKAWMEAMFPDLKIEKSKPLKITDLAVAAADKVSLDLQVGGKKEPTLALGHG